MPGVGHLDGGNSGRYPWGSGDRPYQDGSSWYAYYNALKKSGLTEQELVEACGVGSSTELRELVTITKRVYTREMAYKAIAYAESGMSKRAIAEKLGLPNESSVRSLLNTYENQKQSKIDNTVEVLKKAVADKKYIDITRGAEAQLGVSKTMLNAAVRQLKIEGYEVTYHKIPQTGGHSTSLEVLSAPGTTWKEINDHKDLVEAPTDYISKDRGMTFQQTQWPVSVDSSRIQIAYPKDGGADKDGVIELRRGMDDINLGNSNYAQVRILVDNGLYLKGMCVYNDNMPDGVDIRFNTSKPDGTPLEKVLKPIKETDNPDSIFGATIKAGGQDYYEDPKGLYSGVELGRDPTKMYSLNAVNKVNEEGDWDTWSKTLASQMLSKQSTQLAERQLTKAYNESREEFEKICSLTNPALKQELLQEYADGCDKAAVNLKAAAMPGQKTHVLLPISDLKDNEIYAPNYNNGDTVVLIRYPHGGQFEIPELKVNNTSAQGKMMIGNGPDAVGISIEAARKLSGADFDGDTALVIPNNKGEIKTMPMLKELKDFNMDKYEIPSKQLEEGKMFNEYKSLKRKGLTDAEAYDYIRNSSNYKSKNYTSEEIKEKVTAGKNGVKVMTEREKGLEMGVITNLISDMSFQSPTTDEISRAVKQSMVVIDAYKHGYDYKQAEKDNRIDQLKRKFQTHVDDPTKYGGAQTLISKAKSEQRINEREDGALIKKDGTIVNKSKRKELTKEEMNDYILSSKGTPKVFYSHPETGEKLYSETGRTIIKKNKNGEWVDTGVLATSKSTKMAEAKDANMLSSGTEMEKAFAKYANSMKALGNEARKEYIATPNSLTDKEAKKKYEPEVKSINAKIETARKNAVLERKALNIMNARVKARIAGDETLKEDKDALKKIKAQELTRARNEVGASGKDSKAKLSDREWEAIQAGAISHSKQQELFRNCDKDQLKSLALPREDKAVSSLQVSRIQSMSNSGRTQAEIAKALGVSTSTVSKVLKESRGGV